MAITNPKKPFLGSTVNSFPKTQYDKIVEIVNQVNEIDVVDNNTASPIDVTATATATQVATGLITSTSAAAVSITLPSAASLIAVLPGSKRGSFFDLIVDNSVGANIVTIVASASITAATAVITGGATLTVAAAATGIFRIYFVSTTAAKIYRLG